MTEGPDHYSIGEEISEKASNLNRRFHGPTKGSGLCFRCNNAMIMRRKSEFEPRVYCDEMATMYGKTEVAADIAECSKFSQAGKLSIWDLAKLAKVIDLDEKPSVGFKGELK